MEFKKYKMAMRNRISPKNRDFVIDRERAPFDDNVSDLGEQPVFSQNEFTTTPIIDPAEFPARKEYMQSYSVGGNVRQVFNIGGGAFKGTDLGTREGFEEVTRTYRRIKRGYAGSTIQQHHSKIKDEFLKGKGPHAIYSLDPKNFKSISHVEGAIQSMIAGNSPVKIYQVELEKRIKGSDLTMEKVKQAYDELIEEYKDKGLNQKPNRSDLISRSGSSDYGVDKAIDLYDLDLDKGMSEETKKDFVEKSNKTKDLNRKQKAKNKIIPIIKGKNSKVVGWEGSEDLKQQYIDDMIERLKYPLHTKGDFLSNAEITKKYGLKEPQINKLNPYLKKIGKLPSRTKSSRTAKASAMLITQGDILKNKYQRFTAKNIPGSTKKMDLHHRTPYYGEFPNTSKDIMFLDAKTNRAASNLNRDLNQFADETFKIFNDANITDNEKIKKIDEVNKKAEDLLDDPKNKKFKGIVGYKKITPITDEYGNIINLMADRINLDPSKGIPGPEIELKNISTGAYTPKELETKVSEISDKLLCAVGSSNTTQFLTRKNLTRMATGGRIGFKDGPTPDCIEKGKKKIEEGRIGKSELNAVEKSLTESGKMTPAAQKFFTAAKTAARVGGKIPLELISIGFGPAGVVAGALLELATVQDDLMRGDLKEAWRNTFPGMILKGAGDLVGLDLVGSKRKDILKFAKTPEEIAAVNSMFNYLEGTEKFNETLGDMESESEDVSRYEQYQDPESQFMVSEASRRFYDLEDQAKKLKAILDAQQKDLGTAEGQKMSIDVLRREIASRYNRALTNVSLEQFIEDEINRIYFDIQKQAAPIPDVIDPDTQFNLMNPVRQPFAGGGLSIQDKIQELLASIPGLMIADFVPISEKVQLKRLFDQFNDRYMRKAEGGRIGFKNGPEDINKSRRLFNQLLLGLAALPVVGKYLKLGRGAGKVANITINKTAGMPDFFEPLVNKVINEGIDVTKKMGTQERQTVHLADIADHEVTVYRQLDTGEIDVYINGMKTLYQDAVRLYYKPGQISEEASKAAGKPIKEADEFIAQESSPAYSGSPEDYEITSDGTFETNNFNELASDLTEVEAAVMKQPVTELQKRKKLERYKYYESKEGQQKLLDEQYGEYDDTMRDDVIDE